jgi:hypothetical protein
MIVFVTARLCTNADTIIQRHSGLFFSNTYFKLRLLFAVVHFAMPSAGNCLLIKLNNEQLPALRCDSNIAAASPPMFCSLFIREKNQTSFKDACV